MGLFIHEQKTLISKVLKTLILYIVRKVLASLVEFSNIDDVASCIVYFFLQGKTFLHIFESLMRSHSWFVGVKN